MNFPIFHLRMPCVEAIQVLIDACEDDWIVITNQGSARIWPKLARRPLELHYNPSTMGGAVPLALGIALAQPHRRVVCVTGDGSLLMNLGSLVTVAASGAKNLTIVVLDNELYEVTGGQKTAGSERAAFNYLAWGAGIGVADMYNVLAAWATDAKELLSSPGSERLIVLRVEPTPLEYLKFPTPPIAEQLATFRAALAGSTK